VSAVPSARAVDPRLSLGQRGRTRLVAIVIVVLAAVLVVLDGIARSAAQNLIQTTVRSSLAIPASTPVAVTVGGASVLLQMATGSLERVDVSAPRLALGDLSGQVKLTALGVPVEPGRPAENARVVFALGQVGVQKLLNNLSPLPIKSVAFYSGAVTLGGVVTVFGAAIPIQIVETPSAVDGQLVLTPTSVAVNGKRLSPAALTRSFGSLAAVLAHPQRFCVANVLPKGFRLDRASVSGSSVRLVISAQSVILDEQLFSSKGVCR